MKSAQFRRSILGRSVETIGLLSICVASCSTSEPLLLPANISAIQPKSQDATDAQLKTPGELNLSLSESEVPEPVKALLAGASQASVFEAGPAVSLFGAGTSGVLSLKKKYDTLPSLAPVPSFATGKTFLPVNETITDFWLVSVESGSAKVARPVRPISSASETIMPEHMLASLKADATPLGYSADFLLLTSSESLWIVQRQAGKLSIDEVASPEPGSAFVSAGALSGSSAGFWFATPDKVWVLSSQGSDWSAREFAIRLNGLSGKLSRLSAVLELSGEQLKAKGPLIAFVGQKIGTQGVEVSLGGQNSTPNNPPPPAGAAMTFAQAQALCNGCHATTANNNAAKAKLVGTENIDTWIKNKIVIAVEVQNDNMPPPSGLGPEDKAKFLNFARNPVP